MSTQYTKTNIVSQFSQPFYSRNTWSRRGQYSGHAIARTCVVRHAPALSYAWKKQKLSRSLPPIVFGVIIRINYKMFYKHFKLRRENFAFICNTYISTKNIITLIYSPVCGLFGSVYFDDLYFARWKED